MVGGNHQRIANLNRLLNITTFAMARGDRGQRQHQLPNFTGVKPKANCWPVPIN